HAEERLRARLRELPDGRWEAVQHIDHDGHTELASRVRLTLTKQGETLTFDFAGTDPQARGCINTTWAGLMAGVFTPVLVLLCHDIPWNQGVFNCVQVQADEGILCNCRYPAPCSMATIAGTRLVANCGTLAISKMLSASPRYAREAMAVWAGSSQCPSLAGVSQHGYRFGFMEMSHHAGGGGARSFADGVDLGGVLQNATPSIPNVEATEHSYPLLYLFRRQLVDSGGPGRWRGGVSGEICYVPYDAPPGLSMVLVAYGVEVPNALGLWGGLPTCCVRWVRVRGTDIAERLRAGAHLPLTLEEIPGEVQVFPAMHPRLPFGEGEAWYSNWQGGGGYGDPMDRESERVRCDVENQLVSVACARSIYGVVITPGSGAVDMAGTAALRQQIRQERLARAASQGHLPAGRRRPAAAALEVSSPDPSGRTPAGLDPRGTPGSGERVSFGPVLTADRSSGLLLCRCGATLGAAGDGYKSAAAWEELPLTAAGPIRGEQYRGDRFVLRCFYCPNCATLLETEVTLRGSPPLEDRLFGWPAATAPAGTSVPGGATAETATGGGP
ncbi:MAG: hydantoinase B/oxoprolinase family protein, partial [Deltaproteobacteria bacterium]|nr:hydantoinase B/oxoprolinase family protein [Deltaproteobacteria bacterium]